MRKNKKTRLKLILAIVALAVAVLAILFGTTQFGKSKNDKVVARINKTNIYQSEVENKLSEVFQNEDYKTSIDQFPKEVFETIVKDIYVQKQLDKQASKSKVSKDKEIQKKIADYKNRILRKAYLDSLIAKAVNDETVKNKYTELSTDFAGKKEMRIKHILVKDEATAKKLAEQLKGKKAPSFESLAKKNSLDSANADLGGDLGYVIADNLDEDFAKAVENIKKGQISNPIKTKFGWHLVKVEDVRKVEIPTFESIKPQIEAKLKQDEIERIYGDITKEAKIKILIELKPQPENSGENSEAKQEAKTTADAKKDQSKQK